MNIAQYLGSRQVSGEKDKVVQSWLCQNGNDNLTPPFLNIGEVIQPVASQTQWSAFEIDPQSVQQSFSFGNAKGLQIRIERPISFFVSSANYAVTGRVVVWIESTGEYYAFAPRVVFPNAISGTATNVIETVNVVLPVSIGLGKIQVWFEPNISNAGIGSPSAVATVAVCNFDRQPLVAY